MAPRFKHKHGLYLGGSLLLVVVAAAISWPVLKSALKDHVRPPPSEETINKLLMLETRIRLFAERKRRMPESLQEVVGNGAFDRDLLNDGWGKPLRFQAQNGGAAGVDAIVTIESVQRPVPGNTFRAQFLLRGDGAEAVKTEWIVVPVSESE